jgi:PKD repeat protein
MKNVTPARRLASAAALSLIATMLLSVGPVAAARASAATPASAAAQGTGTSSAISVPGTQSPALGAARPVAPVAPVASLALAASAPQFGTKDQSFSGASTAPSGSKPESKLWYNDGIWWADMWDTVTSKFHIFRLSSSGLVWQDTGTAVDSRGSTRADALWDGVHLYIASHDVASDSSHNTANRPARLYRFSYNSGSQTYSLDSGFPVTITTVSVETLVIDKDSTGTLWATWTQAKKLVIAHTVGSDLVWGTPFTPAITGISLNSDDISSLIAFGGNRIGVMWSNQSASHMYFTTHLDGDPDTTWTASEAVTTGSGSADDHINLKTDSAGRIYAATKTSFTSKSAVLIHLLVRAAGGGWSDIKFGTVAESHTRPIVLIDEQAGMVHMYATGPYPGSSSGQSGGSIYEKTSPIAALSFSSGSGTPVIQDPSSADMNNASSTKQNINASTGIVVLATNDTKDFYWHSTETLGSGTPPTASFSGTPTSGASPLSVAFTDTSTGAPTSWSWDFGDPGSGSANTSTSQNPSHIYHADGSYTVQLTATNASGSTTKTLAGYITVASPPAANFSASPTSGGGPLTVDFTDTSTGNPTSWSWDFGDPGSGSADTSTSQNPSHEYDSDGTYTVALTATNANGSTTKTAVGLIVVGTAPVAAFSGAPTSGSAPLLVDFTDASTGTPTSWTWDFGDPGSGADDTSIDPNPSHTYQADGTYTVKLTVSNATGTDSLTRTSYIHVGTAPTASFTATPTSGLSPLPVSFSDTSTGNPTSWSWDFGDPGSGSANTSTSQNPSHTYAAGGTYTVALTATNVTGSDTDTQTGLITVTSSQVTVTLNPVADSYVSSSNLTGNYGGLTTMKVREGDGSSANPNYRTYLKFDVSGVSGTVSAVTLRLFVTDASANTESVFVVGDSSWTETGITYTNAPAISGSVVGTTKSAPAGSYVSITLVPSSVTPGSSPLTLALKSSATDSFIVSSREDSLNKPQLVVTYQ